MALFTANLQNLIIPSGQQLTSALDLVDDALAVTVNCPSSITGTAITILVEPTSTGTNFVILQSGGADVTVSTGQGVVMTPFPYKQIKLQSNAGEASTRTFQLTKMFIV